MTKQAIETVIRWKASGKKQAEFCVEENIKLCTLQGWVYQAKKTRLEEGVKTEGFLPVKVVSSGYKLSRNETPERADAYCEIMFSGGGRITIKRSEDLEELSKILTVFSQTR